MLPNQTTDIFKYRCLIEFVYANQANRSFTRTGIFFQKNLHILKLLIMFDMQYWKCNNIYSAWKIKEKLKISILRNKMNLWVILMHLLNSLLTHLKWTRVVVLPWLCNFPLSPKILWPTSWKNWLPIIQPPPKEVISKYILT